MHRKNLQRICLVLAAGPSLVAAAAWCIQSWSRLFEGLPVAAGRLGNLCALTGLPLLALMAVLGARFGPVERLFGLDRMLRLHKKLGTVIAILFSSHALLRFVKVSLLSETGWVWAFLFSFPAGDIGQLGMNLARIALVGLLGAAGLARMGDRVIPLIVVPYRLWKPPHLVLYGAIPLGLAHSRLVGDDIGRFPYSWIWYGAAAVFLIITASRIRYVRGRGRHCSFTLKAIIPETPDASTFVLARPEGLGAFMRRSPGQFCTLRLPAAGPWSEPHPFTLSCAADAAELSCTIKRCGDFTAALSRLEIGSAVLCEGPYGVFIADMDPGQHTICIAGGIGVTPFISMIRSLPEKADARLTLIWNIKTIADIWAAQELEQATSRKPLRVVYVLSRQAPPEGAPRHGPVVFEQGHVSAGLLQRHIDHRRASFCVCGPERMQRFVLKELEKAFSVRPVDVRRELFFW